MNDPTALAVQVVAAYVSANKLSAADLPGVIFSVREAISRLANDEVDVPPVEDHSKSKAEIRRSVTPDALISFLDGKPYRTLKRHLATKGMTMADYRARFGLPADYPSTSPNYSAQRSAMARSMGLGRKPQQAAAPTPEVVVESSPGPKKRAARGKAPV